HTFPDLFHQPTAICINPPSIEISTVLLPKAVHRPNREGKVCLKSKASAPGKARPIRMDAGILCDQAYLS
ncbi:hypothetical protein WKG84_02770, partial [Pantoea agglomerans]|uniref:hypothetical protein n=1 Tax=Enterobacter agglomerans TaxID=549 RepID=UPI003C797FC0